MSFGAIASVLGGFGIGQLGNYINSAMQFEHQKALMRQQFEYNKWFVQNAHQNEVADLRKAGLNPVLSANGGQTASVGLGSSALANDQSMANTMSDAYNTAVQNANSARQVDSTVSLNNEQENLLRQQTVTEQNKRDNLDSQSKLNLLNAEGKEIENMHLPSKLKSEIKLNNNSAKAAIINADANKIGAGASAKSAEASMIGATQGNIQRYLINKADSIGSNFGKIYGGIGKSQVTDYVRKNRNKAIQHRLKYGY